MKLKDYYPGTTPLSAEQLAELKKLYRTGKFIEFNSRLLKKPYCFIAGEQYNTSDIIQHMLSLTRELYADNRGLKNLFTHTRSAVSVAKKENPLRPAEEEYFRRAGEFDCFLKGQRRMNDYIEKLGVIIKEYSKQNKVCVIFSNNYTCFFKDFEELAKTLIKEWELEIFQPEKQVGSAGRE